MPVEDYYSLIGVSSDADRDEIKEAYRARRSELDDSDGAKAAAAQLNKAWNVLSDANQRDKYDDQLAVAKADDNVIIPEIVGTAGSNGSRPLTKAEQRRARMQGGKGAKNANRPVRTPIAQNTEINGVPLANNRDRVMALVIDGLICFAILFVGATAVSAKMADSQKPEVVKKVDQLQKSQTSTQKQIDATAKQRDAEKDTIKKSALNAQKKQLETKFDQLQKDIIKEDGKLNGLRVTSFAGGTVLAMLIFAVPSALTGRSPGKAIRKLKLVKMDGSPAGWSGALTHYGVVLGFLLITSALGQLAQISWIVAVFGVSSFNRNPNRQGWHDRIAKTLVVQG